jgi:chromosome segregation ATPase
MKAKILLPWLCAAALLAGAAYLHSSNRQKDAELAGLRETGQQAEQLRGELAQVKTNNANQNAEVARLQSDNADLLRLRNEVRQLREEKQQLTKQAQAAQTDAQRAQAQVQLAQAARASAQQQAQQLQQLQTENQQLRTSVQQQQNAPLLACINNLRQIDGAKQQWALENRKPANAVPTAQDVAPYLRGGVLPACPAGGQYTLNSLSAVPTCSIPGHVLPR